MTQGSQLKAMDSYFKSLLSETVTDNVPQVVPVKEPVVAAQVPFAEPVVEQQTRLADLLAQVEPLSEAKVVVKTETQVKVAPKVLQPPAPPAWKNIDPGKEFQALFFVVSGVTFAVPLTELVAFTSLPRSIPCLVNRTGLPGS